jgi:NAD-dependent SIR2 family protein deacetylase
MTIDDDGIWCQGHKCNTVLPPEKMRSSCTINVPLCPDCYQRLMMDMVEEYGTGRRITNVVPKATIKREQRRDEKNYEER